jgi:hypothetical protein
MQPAACIVRPDHSTIRANALAPFSSHSPLLQLHTTREVIWRQSALAAAGADGETPQVLPSLHPAQNQRSLHSQPAASQFLPVQTTCGLQDVSP